MLRSVSHDRSSSAVHLTGTPYQWHLVMACNLTESPYSPFGAVFGLLVGVDTSGDLLVGYTIPACTSLVSSAVDRIHTPRVQGVVATGNGILSYRLLQR